MDNNSKHIPVFFASDNNYAKLIAVAAVSMLKNTKSFIDIIILDNGITEENKEKIKKSLEIYNNHSLEFIKIDGNYINSFPDTSGAKHVTKTMYSRFLIPELKPEYDKAIYSDVDVIFMGDIKQLYDEPLEGHVIGAVPDDRYLINKNQDNCRERLNLEENHVYFNSGIILIDINEWNKQHIREKLINIAQKYKNKLKFGDQDILNIGFMNDYKILDFKYNSTNAYLENQSLFLNAKRYIFTPPIIRHFEGGIKPWNNSAKIPYAEEFGYYAKKTLFYEDFKNYFVSGKSFKGKCYKTLKELLKLFPYFFVHNVIKKIDSKIIN